MVHIRIEIDTDKLSADGTALKATEVHNPPAYNLTSVRVVSMIPFAGTALETNFITGLQGVTYITPALHDLGYNPTTLKNAVITAGSTNNTLVATIGGLAAAVAAKGTSVPFISLAGGTYSFYSAPTANFLGGLNLNSFNNDQTFISYLGSLGIAKTKIGLLFNPNSVLANQEFNVFVYAEAAAIDQSNMNSALEIYTTAFGKFPKAVEVVIISADPFFAQTAQQLVQAASGFPFCILYPSSAYASYVTNRYILYPPQATLPQLCNSMGGIAAAVVRSGQPWINGYLPVPLGSPTNNC